MKFADITFTGAVLQVCFSIQPTRTPACDAAQGTRAVGRSVSRWYQISHAI